MGTRGTTGFIVNEELKASYNHFDSYPSGLGVATLEFLRTYLAEDPVGELRRQAMRLQVVDEETKPTPEQVKYLSDGGFANLSVGEQSETDWYCLLRETQGDWSAILDAGYMLDGRNFPLDSLFCEWAYVINLDTETLEVYEGFQKELPKEGYWAGRPTAEEDKQVYQEHLAWCLANDREPWRPEVSEYKAVKLIATYPLAELPEDEDFLAYFELRRARGIVADYDEWPEDVASLWKEIRGDGRMDEGKKYAAEWAEIEAEAFAKIKPSDLARLTA